jgi:hypothetical protein
MLTSFLLLSLLQSQTPDVTTPPDVAEPEPASPEATPTPAAPATPATPPGKGALPPADKVTDGLDGFVLKAAQLGSCGAVWVLATGVTLVASYVPFVGGCVGCAACLVMPAVYGTAVTATGNYLGNRQAPLLWPIVSIYIGGLITSVVSLGTGVGAFIALGASLPTLANLNPALAFGAFLVPAVVVLGVSVLGMLITGVVSTFVWDANAVPKTEQGQFQLALTDMDQPLFGGAPKDAPPKTPPNAPPTAQPSPPASGASPTLSMGSRLPLRRLLPMAY